MALRATEDKDYIAGGWCGSTLSSFADLMGVDLTEPGLTESRSSFEGLKNGTRLAGTSTLAPVLGLRPVRAFRCRVRKLPKPRISILSPAFRAPMTDSKRVSTMTSPSRRVRSPRAVTLSTRSALVMSGSFPFQGGQSRLGNVPKDRSTGVDYKWDASSVRKETWRK